MFQLGFVDDIDNVDDADRDPINEINPQIGGTRNLIGDGGGAAQIDCLIGEIKLYGAPMFLADSYQLKVKY